MSAAPVDPEPRSYTTFPPRTVNTHSRRFAPNRLVGHESLNAKHAAPFLEHRNVRDQPHAPRPQLRIPLDLPGGFTVDRTSTSGKLMPSNIIFDITLGISDCWMSIRQIANRSKLRTAKSRGADRLTSV